MADNAKPAATANTKPADKGADASAKPDVVTVKDSDGGTGKDEKVEVSVQKATTALAHKIAAFDVPDDRVLFGLGGSPITMGDYRKFFGYDNADGDASKLAEAHGFLNKDTPNSHQLFHLNGVYFTAGHLREVVEVL